MSLLFVAARLSAAEWASVPFDQRVGLVREHYVSRPGWSGMVERQWFFPQAGIGIYVAYQQQPRKLFFHESREGRRTDFISHAPFGYQLVAPGTPLERLPSALARAVDNDSTKLLDLSPAQNLVTVDEDASTFLLRNDLLGLAKAYMLKAPGGEVIASRPIAAHLMAAHKPVLSSMGWAAQQLHGWFLSHLTPFQNTRELLGGTTIRMDFRGLHEARHLHVAKWFTEPPARSMFAGFERFMAEFAEFVEPDEMDVALSGGRDSRASAALFLHYYQDKVRLRTNEPPMLEGIVARQLVERLPNFERFRSDRSTAYDGRGRVIWRANNPKVVEVEVFSRSAQWAYIAEGMNVPVAIYGNPPPGPVFSAAEQFIPAIAGVAGESAKAYYWSPNMVSGAYAKSLQTFRQDITTVPIAERLKTHPLTMPSDTPIIAQEYRVPLLQVIRDSQREATSLGIHGYRFLDYWWLTNRFGVGSVLFGATSIMPFLVPEYTSYALQRPPMERTRGQTLSEIVSHFQPEWSGVAYFDELQNSVPREQLRAYRDRSILWEGDLAGDFFSMVDSSPALDDPFNRDEIRRLYRSEIDSGQKQALNVRALGLIQRHTLWEYCNEIGERIACARKPNAPVQAKMKVP